MKEIGAFLLGVTVGAIAAVLFAPQSGDELRAKIKTTAEKDWEILQDKWQEEITTIQERIGELQQQTKQALQTAEAASSDVVETA